MPSLRLESATDSLDLDYVFKHGYGVQSLSGVTGFGLPPVEHQWLEAAGDGAQHLGMRVKPRVIDMPLLVQGRSRDELKSLLRRLSVMLSGRCTLYWVDDDGYQWSTAVWRVGGGDFIYGADTTGTYDLTVNVSFQAGDPYFTSTSLSKRVVSAKSHRGILSGGSLVKIKVSGSSVIGSMTLDNDGDAPAFPKWTVVGPGNHFRAVSPSGEELLWNGSLSDGEILTIDCATGVVTDSKNVNRYDDFDIRPRFWRVPVGTSTAEASISGVVGGKTSITCEWRARRWVVI